MPENKFSILLKYVAPVVVAGNVVFVLWILYNGINEGFAGTNIEKISYVTLMMLLLANAIIIYRKQSD
ncbi:MAG TPA: hypothetical protein DCX54_01915 [Flavobacteriales bacterium]|nr:hypothetical protein [Flavobacteriales bacterium]